MALFPFSLPQFRPHAAIRLAATETPRHYAAADVRHLLHPESRGPADARRAAHEVAALPSAWARHLSPAQAQPLGRLAAQLPTIVYLYAAGTPVEAMRGRVGSNSPWSIEQALDAACGCIAEELNRSQTARR